MKRLQFVFSLLALPFLSQAQVQLSGVAANTEQQPVVGAQIIDSASGSWAVSQTNGSFVIELPPSTKQATLVVHALGFGTVKARWKTGEPASLGTVELPANTLLNETPVYGIKANTKTPMAVSELSQEAIANNNTGRDIPFVLEQIPGAVATSDAGAGVGYTGLRIRGSDATRINVTINGIPLNDAESQGVFWVNTPDLASSLSGIQVQRGVGTSTNGAGAFGATINLETEETQARAYGKTILGVGSFNTLRTTLMAGTGLTPGGWFANARLSQITSDGYLERASSRLQSYAFTTGYKGKKDEVTAYVFGGAERTYQAWYGIDSLTWVSNPRFNYAGALYDTNWNVTGYYPNEVDDYRQDHYQLHWKRRWNASWSSNLGLHYTYGRGFYEQYRQSENFADYALENPVFGSDTIRSTDLVRRLWLNNHFYGVVGSIAYQKDKWEMQLGGSWNHYQGDHYGELVWMQLAAGSAPGDSFYFNSSNKYDAQGYVKAYYSLNQKLTLFADLQVRQVIYTGQGNDEGQVVIGFEDNLFFFNPKAGADYRLNAKNRVYASVAMANREPARTDYVEGETTPKAEQLVDVEMGWQHQENRWFVQANAYFMDYQNQLVLTGAINNVGSFIRANVGSSFRTGLELVGHYAFSPEFSWNSNLSYSVNQNRNFLSADENGNLQNLGATPIAYSPNWVGGSTLSYQKKHWQIALVSKWVGSQYLSNRERHKLPGYFLQDLRVAVNGSVFGFKEVELGVFVNNLFNTSYVSNGYVYANTPYYYAQAGTNFLANLTLSL